MRCSGEGPGSKVVGWWTSFGAAGRKKLTGKACPQWRGSAVGKRRRQAGSRGHRLGQSSWGGNTRRRSARGVVDSVEERLERAVHGGARRAGRSGGEGPEGLLGLELDGL
jgi:hypothetical protein